MSKVIREGFGFRILRCVIGRKRLVSCYEPIRRPRFPALLVVCLFFFSSIAHWFMMKTFLMRARCDHFGQLQTTIDIYLVYFCLATFFRTGLYHKIDYHNISSRIKRYKHRLKFSVTQTKESLSLHSTNRRSYF